jgi:hypothetical protein
MMRVGLPLSTAVVGLCSAPLAYCAAWALLRVVARGPQPPEKVIALALPLAIVAPAVFALGMCGLRRLRASDDTHGNGKGDDTDGNGKNEQP